MSAEEKSTSSRFGRVVTLLPVLIFTTLATVFLWSLLYKDDRLPSPLIGKTVPQFDLPPIEGREVGFSSADLQGQVSLVNVWASWCVPCRVEMPLLVALAKDGVVPIYGINFKDDAEAALSFLAELGDPYTRLGADQSGRVAIDWGVYGLPETFVIDASGQIAYKHVGPFDQQSLEEEILPVVRRLQEQQRP
ncbi:DsbE family thiol:disulfide interchange protein [Agrobacterium pusense]|uniref:DsbE family thiol:disulfide interchange protein n=1 Tax=Agrobacterium pusense TaxID=648995 RepID=UPI000D1BAB49|nr:DsbE family thiol:disulfide interchange protein [Agrobacterium pusense]